MHNNYLTNDTKVIIMLCGVFGKDRSVSPLTQTEYNKLVGWLVQAGLRPEDMLKHDVLSDASKGSGIEQSRLDSLMSRGVQLGFALEDWQNNGVWVISRSDPDYPQRYKKHLKDKAPPLLFGIGEKHLLQGGGLAIVGSRNVDEEGKIFAQTAAELCALNNMPVISGGARGVDINAMSTVLQANGVCIGVLADSLLKKSLEPAARIAITDGRLLLISPYHPKAGFSVGTAMARNKLIYAMADYALIVSSEYKTGGTWAGAKEELRREQHRPVFVRNGENVPKGNLMLLESGAVEFPNDIDQRNFTEKLDSLSNTTKLGSKTLFDYKQEPSAIDKGKIDKIEKKNEKKPKKNSRSAYDVVLPLILEMTETRVKPGELAKQLDVSKNQIKNWLTRAENEHKIEKVSKKPIEYIRNYNVNSL
ncbi:DNA protecting protein DprA [Limihaloglobus sulfuriphilus]|uniref:DNA protecting protein DprA n=1 Tax=Limihaloglobus sulfuriphilus TaxID=1851148 RepID=A0A1Q2MI11_9BACT|nr:DNA-processing protein DprA [Limihaloglobus sulfuriphilus]AQQ72289.1 DNA protecting protein DprA [Limihaloglobus sulfuriphilus]